MSYPCSQWHQKKCSDKFCVQDVWLPCPPDWAATAAQLVAALGLELSHSSNSQLEFLAKLTTCTCGQPVGSHSCSSLSCHQIDAYLIWSLTFLCPCVDSEKQITARSFVLRDWALSAAVSPVRVICSQNVVPRVSSLASVMETSSIESLKAPRYWQHTSYCWWLLSLDLLSTPLVPATLELNKVSSAEELWV